jgi:orotate phosphoribosyltransferase
MESDLIALVPGRAGHFRLESGHHGEQWLNLDALFLWPGRLDRFVATLAERLAVHGAEVFCGPLVGGAFVAERVAAELDAAFVYVERVVEPDLDAPVSVTYRVPSGLRGPVAGKRVAVVDDAINAGSAVGGSVADLRRCGAEVVALGALLALGDTARAYAAAQGLPLETVATVPNTIWEPDECPHCAAGVILEDLAG